MAERRAAAPRSPRHPEGVPMYIRAVMRRCTIVALEKLCRIVSGYLYTVEMIIDKQLKGCIWTQRGFCDSIGCIPTHITCPIRSGALYMPVKVILASVAEENPPT